MSTPPTSPARTAQTGVNRKLLTALALLAILVGAYLRFHTLASIGLWSDELFTVAAALDVGAGHSWLSYTSKVIPELTMDDSFLTWKAADNTPPLFELLLIVWSKLFGVSDFALRSLPAVLGSLAPLVFYFGLRRPLGALPALLGAICFCVAPAAITLSQEVRAYMLTMLLSTIAVILLINRVLAENSGSEAEKAALPSFWLDVVVYILLGYSHYTGLFTYGLLSAVYFFLVIVPRKRYSHFFKLLLVPFAIAPWFALSWKAFRFTSQGGLAWTTYSTSDILGMMFPKTLDFFLAGAGPLLLAVWLSAFICALCGRDEGGRWFLSSASIKQSLQRKKALLALMLIAVIALQFGYSVYNSFHARMWHPRYFAASLPILLVSFALLFSAMRPGKLIATAITAVFVCFSLLGLKPYYAQHSQPGEEYDASAAYVSKIAEPNHVVLLGWAANAAFYNHYLKQYPLAGGQAFKLLPVSTPQDTSDFCAAIRPDGKQVIVLQHNGMQYAEQLASCPSLTLIQRQGFQGLNVTTYRAHSAKSAP
ncbi:Uncharacterized membrane protein [Duganella sp. CF458]|uniref:glycosyltransferase family 39 protein n=1 Tax=Duganella sp. CF458 TaxID=1884368 RepID=UPI0008F4285E|nr:glycosyltransferase family 39 protein [Duganella sp. CF458]SFG20786.1 Uncharacterized membrane protein [Duganella sp. CF458]